MTLSHGMFRRKRLNFSDNQLVRADELRLGQRFIDVDDCLADLIEGTDEPGRLIVRSVIGLTLFGDDVEVACADGVVFSTSIGNTFITMPPDQVTVERLPHIERI